MKKPIAFICLIVLVSCGKEPLKDQASSMIGTWVHYDAADAWEKVIIKTDGKGKVEWYTNNKLHKETKEKEWFIKGNQMYLGKATFNLGPFDISDYPTTSSSTVIEGYDTLTQGLRYCVMNDKYFVEKE